MFTLRLALVLFLGGMVAAAPPDGGSSPGFATDVFRLATLRPIDEGIKDKSFAAFRVALLRAIERRDRAFVRRILHRDIQVDFGGGVGPKDFAETWWPAKGTRPTDLWRVLARVMAGGGTFLETLEGKRQFCAPYLYSAFPQEFDGYDNKIIVGEHVAIRARPDAAAPVLAYVDHAIVEEAEEGPQQPESWLAIQGERSVGYVEWMHVRSAIDWRACFVEAKHGWLMTALVSGD